MITDTVNRTEMLHALARDYVVKGLGDKNFDAIPYDEAVKLRAPICPGGSDNPLIGKENLRDQWWAPLPGLIAGVEVLDTYVNMDKSAATVEFYCHIAQPKCTLRIMDRFIINDAGKIIAQENFFDPRAITNPA